MQYIKLITFSHFEKDFLDEIVKNVAHVFAIEVVIEETNLDITDFYDPVRRQYDGNEILKEIDEKYTGDSFKVLGLFQIDLFIPILTYIFGQAFLNGNAGIVSLYRLKNERYGIKANEKLLRERTVKEIIHELGHTFGLKHCHVPTCVMRSSTYVEDIDQKKAEFCFTCRENMKQT